MRCPFSDRPCSIPGTCNFLGECYATVGEYDRGHADGYRDARADERARLRALLESEAVIEAASLEIGKLRCAEAGGCYAPDGEADEDCSYGDCWCARQAEKEARAALAAVAKRVEGGEDGEVE